MSGLCSYMNKDIQYSIIYIISIPILDKDTDNLHYTIVIGDDALYVVVRLNVGLNMWIKIVICVLSDMPLGVKQHLAYTFFFFYVLERSLIC